MWPGESVLCRRGLSPLAWHVLQEQYRHALQQQMAEQHRAGQPPASVDHDYASSLPGMGGQQHGRDNPHALSKVRHLEEGAALWKLTQCTYRGIEARPSQ